MSVKKVTTKKPAAPAAKKEQVEKVKASVKRGGKVTTEAPKAAAKPVKPKSADQARKDMLKPALEAKMRQDALNRAEQIVENDLVKVDPKDAKIPLAIDPISAIATPGLMEYEVPGTAYRLLAMEDSNATPTLEQRVHMARRLLDVGPKLPKYVKTVEKKEPEFDNAVLAVAAGVSPAAKAPSTPKKSGEPATEAAPAIPNGVPLKKICGDINVDPKIARRILRSKGKRPAGRWEWDVKEVDAIKEMLKVEAAKLAGRG